MSTSDSEDLQKDLKTIYANSEIQKTHAATLCNRKPIGLELHASRRRQNTEKYEITKWITH